MIANTELIQQLQVQPYLPAPLPQRAHQQHTMTITEIALLLLSSGITLDNTDLRSNLSLAKKTMDHFTGYNFYYMQQIEDPAYIYIIGEWDSLDQHMKGFIPGPDNQALLEDLKDLLTVTWLEHIDASHAELPLPKDERRKGQALRGEMVWSIGRHFVKSGEKDAFKETFEENKQYLQEYVTEGRVSGGWRVDKEEGKEEYVLFSPWKSVEQHMGFGKTEGFQKYGRIRKHIDGAEIKHARLLDI
jgi:heme-degrading monooxygenase HmoA